MSINKILPDNPDQLSSRVDSVGRIPVRSGAARPLDPNSPCSTCAYGTAGGAAKEPHNRLKGQICALGGIPFFCHHAPDGRELNWHGGPAEYFASMRDRRDIRMCAGWKREVAGY